MFDYFLLYRAGCALDILYACLLCIVDYMYVNFHSSLLLLVGIIRSQIGGVRLHGVLKVLGLALESAYYSS